MLCYVKWYNSTPEFNMPKVRRNSKWSLMKLEKSLGTFVTGIQLCETFQKKNEVFW